MPNSLVHFLRNPLFDEPYFETVWKSVVDKKSFSKEQSNSLVLKRVKNKSIPEAVFSPDNIKKSYLPIEFLRGEQDFYTRKGLVQSYEKCFLSSGTTSKNRSKSYFSKDGLLFYKLSSLKTFYDLLSYFFKKEENLSVSGISLVPKKESWPDSSLAQMLSWFSEFWDLNYCDQESLLIQKPLKPIWIFGTALHFKNLIDRNIRFPLPKGSIVIETGGLKSSKESFSKKEFYEGLSDVFSVPVSKIISEYGMCELSCQAYDFYRSPLDSKSSGYKFPFWVKAYVSKPGAIVEEKGKGCLLLEDPLRIDYPYAFRTQDIIDLEEKGCFNLFGRVPSSVLKGCSLLAEDLLCNKKNKETKEVVCLKEERVAFFEEENLSKVLTFLVSFFAKKIVKDALLKEYQSEKMVSLSISDFLKGFPQSKKELKELIKKNEAKKGEKWLLVLPNSHVFCLFYPCVLAFFLGISLTVRLSRSYPKGSIAELFIKEFKRIFNCSLGFLGPEMRIPHDIETKSYDGLVAYGSNETFFSLKDQIFCPSIFFGSTLSASVITDFSDEEITAMIKDSFSLGQKGCFSSRLTFCLLSEKAFEEEKGEIEKKIKEKLNCFFKNGLTLESLLALDHEKIRVSEKKGVSTLPWGGDLPLVLFYKKDSFFKVNDFLSSCQFVLPIVFASSKEEIFRLVSHSSELRKLSVSKRVFKSFASVEKKYSFEVCSLGSLNKTDWNGFHQGKAFFVSNVM